MKVEIKNELVIIGGLTLLYVALFPFFNSLVFGLIIGLPLVVFFPGYMIMAALFPRQHPPGGLERVGLSFGTSIFLSPLVGILYQFTPIGIRPYPVLTTLAAIVLGGGAFAWRQRHRLPEAERLVIAFNIGFLHWGRSALVDKGISIVLAVSIIGAMGAVGYSLTQPLGQEPFSELYLLGQEGKAVNYPREVIVGKATSVIVGIANQESKQESYRLEIWLNGQKNSEVSPLLLAPGEKWEKAVSFTPVERGENQKLELLLFRGSETQPRTPPVYLWLNAREVGEKFTLFYVTNFPMGGPHGLMEVGATHTAYVQIINHEGETVDYWVQMLMDGVEASESQTYPYPNRGEVTLEDGETREIDVYIHVMKAGEQRMEFRLYKKGEDQPIRSVSFMVTTQEAVK